MADSNPTEVWRPIVGYEALYEVSDLGRVRSIDKLSSCHGVHWRSVAGRIMKQYLSPSGANPSERHKRWRVALSKEGKYKKYFVHRLVLEAFVGACPPGMQGCHNDGNGRNNIVTNLRWDTPKNNSHDRIAHGTVSLCGRKRIDITGQRFGRLVALSGEYNGREMVWLCKCDCGNVAHVTGSRLRSGITRSCSCLFRDVASARGEERRRYRLNSRRGAKQQ